MSLGGLESVSPQWGFEQLTPITGRLTLDGAYIPMEMRTVFPVHPELNQLSHVMQIDFDAGGIGSDTVCNLNCGSRSGYYQHED